MNVHCTTADLLFGPSAGEPVAYDLDSQQGRSRYLDSLNGFFSSFQKRLKIELLSEELIRTGKFAREPSKAAKVFHVVVSLVGVAGPALHALHHLHALTFKGVEVAAATAHGAAELAHLAENTQHALHHEPRLTAALGSNDKLLRHELAYRVTLAYRHEIGRLQHNTARALGQLLAERVLEIFPTLKPEQVKLSGLEAILQTIVARVAPDPLPEARRLVLAFLEEHDERLVCSNNALVERICLYLLLSLERMEQQASEAHVAQLALELTKCRFLGVWSTRTIAQKHPHFSRWAPGQVLQVEEFFGNGHDFNWGLLHSTLHGDCHDGIHHLMLRCYHLMLRSLHQQQDLHYPERQVWCTNQLQAIALPPACHFLQDQLRQQQEELTTLRRDVERLNAVQFAQQAELPDADAPPLGFAELDALLETLQEVEQPAKVDSAALMSSLLAELTAKTPEEQIRQLEAFCESEGWTMFETAPLVSAYDADGAILQAKTVRHLRRMAVVRAAITGMRSVRLAHSGQYFKDQYWKSTGTELLDGAQQRHAL